MAPGDDAWHSFLLANGLGVAMRVVERDDGSRVIGDLYLTADRITPELLRSVPLGRFEDTVNRFGHLEQLRLRPKEDGGPSVNDLREELESGRRALPDDRHKGPIPSYRAADRPRLTRPERGTDLDAFYRFVAEVYKEYALQTKAAALSMAHEADVPVTTAHRWVRESRRRGFLPKGRAGKTG